MSQHFHQDLVWAKPILYMNDNTLATGTHHTAPLTFIIPGNHLEIIHLFLIHSSASPGILESPWLAHHNPQFELSAGMLTSWNISCPTNCLHCALSSLPSSQVTSWGPTSLHCTCRVPWSWWGIEQWGSKQTSSSFQSQRKNTFSMSASYSSTFSWTSFVKAEKCDFHSSSVSLPGFVVQQGQFLLDPTNVTAVADWQTPSSHK